MVSLRLPPDATLRTFLADLNAGHFGVGIINIQDGRVYLASSADLQEAEHSALIERELGILHYEDAPHVRGFTVGKLAGEMWICNLSGLNPLNNRMEQEWFEALVNALVPYVGPVRRG